jgi:hypothetical protein
MIRKYFVTLWVAVGSVFVLGLAWLGMVEAGSHTTYGNTATATANVLGASVDSGLVTPARRATPDPVRQSRAS